MLIDWGVPSLNDYPDLKGIETFDDAYGGGDGLVSE